MDNNLTSGTCTVVATAVGTDPAMADIRRGALLVAASALAWSFGGAIARLLSVADPWTIVAWRSIFAALFLLAFMLWRDGPRGTLRLFATMGLPGIAVGLCFATASICFIVALQYTTVANILLMQAGVPLIAAFLAVVFLGERVGAATWCAILVVMSGVAVMVSDSIGSGVSRVAIAGDALALLIALSIASATVVTRHYSGVRMTPAVCFGAVLGAAVGLSLSGSMQVDSLDLALLFVFGALNLGLGLALFVTGTRLIPSAMAALISTLEPVLGPVWVWLAHAEVPAGRTLIGGAIVLCALISHTLWQSRNDGPDRGP